MKKRLLFVLVYVSFLQISFSQNITSNEFIDIGVGIGHTGSINSAFNIGVTIFTNKYIAWHPEYNMFYGKNGLIFHEINLKFGPYIRLNENKNTYVSLSSGLSYMIDNKESGWEQTDSSPYPSQTYVYEERFFCIPIQVKLNINVYKKLNIGIKTTLNKIISGSQEDKGTFLIYTGFAL